VSLTNRYAGKAQLAVFSIIANSAFSSCSALRPHAAKRSNLANRRETSKTNGEKRPGNEILPQLSQGSHFGRSWSTKQDLARYTKRRAPHAAINIDRLAGAPLLVEDLSHGRRHVGDITFDRFLREYRQQQLPLLLILFAIHRCQAVCGCGAAPTREGPPQAWAVL